MKNSNILISVSLLSILLLLSGSSYAQTTFTNFIAFGDSLSDTGNINSGLPNLPPPFYQNRISNGPVGADYIAQSIGFNATASERGGNNYAVAGGNIVGSDREDLASQIDDYLFDTENQAEPGALYFVLMGGNDIRGLRSQTSREMAEARIDEMISAYMLQLDRLSSAGARRFLVTNVADIGRIPETLMRESSDLGVVARVSLYSQIFNTRLSLALTEFSVPPNVQLVEFDLFSEFSAILDSPSSFGFNYFTIGCVEISSEDIFDLLASIIFPYAPECLFGLRFDEFVFFDNIHPTRATNRLIGEKMVALLTNASFLTPSDDSKGAVISAISLLLLSD